MNDTSLKYHCELRQVVFISLFHSDNLRICHKWTYRNYCNIFMC